MLFTKNGCVACQLEQTGEEAKQARAERDAALAEVERLRGELKRWRMRALGYDVKLDDYRPTKTTPDSEASDET